MPVIHWIDNDVGYEAWLAEHPTGFMGNVNRQPHQRYFRIHRATHRLPDRSNPGSVNPRTGNDYSKVTADHLVELVEWATVNIPALVLGEANYCKTCDPASSSSIDMSPTSDPAEYIARAERIMARGHVERPTGSAAPAVEQGTTAVFKRDPKVCAWVLQRACGCCELCNSQAPFLKVNDEPYLESHHIIWLAEGGADTPENTSALCPNCHRRMHSGKDRLELREKLIGIIAGKEAS